MSKRPKIVCVGEAGNGNWTLPRELSDSFDVVQVESSLGALNELAEGKVAGMYVMSDHFNDAARIGRLLQNERVLEGLPDGVVLIDDNNTIIWTNQRFWQWSHLEDLAGANFYSALDNPEILGPDFCPFHTALVTGEPSNSTLRTDEHHFYQIHAAPVFDDSGVSRHLIVTVRDVSEEVLQQQKLDAIHRAGLELADLTAEEVYNMEVEDRIELLKSNILHYATDLLNFNFIEIRLHDQKTGRLEPLLSVGIHSDAATRTLYAQPQNNGVTGFVAATGKSYLCEDTSEDPLYIEGFPGAKSSLTVPLIWHDQVIGTFNVESPEPRAFTESDLQFLEIFSRDLAVALNTLELLVAQQVNTAQASVEAIHSAVALPIDEILNDAVNVMERYIGHEPDVVERLRAILQNARDIKQVIQKVGQKMAPVDALPQATQVEQRPKLRNRRILVIDADETVRNDAHHLLERYGCVVETAHGGGEAIYMIRNSADLAYDAIIADIRLPDISGYELLVRLQELMDKPPLVLMTGFGYDPGHSIVKARRAGLKANAVLYKPFRLDQLLETVENILDGDEADGGSEGDPTSRSA